ncbi:MAG TPA: hypothetical protein VFA03_08320 [Acetobacteraceae bacterium]|nr:hypothetical protein [Acetobacteraceae bacterium]
MRMRFGLGLAVAGLVVSSGVRALETSYYRAGRWSAFAGKDAQGHLVCGMRTNNPADGRAFEIEGVIGTPGLTFIAARPTWQIPPGTAIPVVMTLPGNVPWTVQGSGAGTEVRWTLDQPGGAGFIGAFRAAETMTVSFPSGNEPPWTMVLTGSNLVGGTFLRCVQDYSAEAPSAAPAPPAAPQPPTQPYGGATTQPFTPPVAATPEPAPGTPPQAGTPQLPALPPLPPAGQK